MEDWLERNYALKRMIQIGYRILEIAKVSVFVAEKKW